MLQRKPKARKSAGRKALREGKRLGKSTRPKDAWKSREHLDRVKAEPCIVSTHAVSWVRTPCDGPMDPHHCRKLLPAGLLPRDDRLTIPACRRHHHELDGDEREYWRRHGIDPAAWIAAFSEAGRKAIEALRQSPGGRG